MKKIAILILTLFVGTFAFAAGLSEKSSENFLTKGNFLKVVTEDTVEYFTKNIIQSLSISEDSVSITTSIEEEYFDIEDYNFSLDESYNLIITEK